MPISSGISGASAPRRSNFNVRHEPSADLFFISVSIEMILTAGFDFNIH
jgi:hypothetical protein